MPWKVRFRDKDFNGDEGWDPEFEFEVKEALTDTQELPGSAEIAFNGIHGHHPELGEVFIFSGVPDEGEGQLIALYSAKDFGDPPYNDERFTGDGS